VQRTNKVSVPRDDSCDIARVRVVNASAQKSPILKFSYSSYLPTTFFTRFEFGESLDESHAPSVIGGLRHSLL
jgi:hypothetical protein